MKDRIIVGSGRHERTYEIDIGTVVEGPSDSVLVLRDARAGSKSFMVPSCIILTALQGGAVLMRDSNIGRRPISLSQRP